MSEPRDGGPAFPADSHIDASGWVYPATGGMSPRDWFAGQEKSDPTPVFAQEFFGGNHPPSDEANPKTWIKCRAAWKYAISDAMLAERAK